MKCIELQKQLLGIRYELISFQKELIVLGKNNFTLLFDMQ